MSAAKPQTTKPKGIRRAAAEVDPGFRWGTLNTLLLAIGIAVLAVGYLLLTKGDITMAPILLVLGYVVLVPASLLVRGKAQTAGE
jgi:hypothetical protein